MRAGPQRNVEARHSALVLKMSFRAPSERHPFNPVIPSAVGASARLTLSARLILSFRAPSERQRRQVEEPVFFHRGYPRALGQRSAYQRRVVSRP
jgi:hypothetical protein